jgi:hypothetical protein
MTSCLVAGATLLSSPADAQRKKAAPSGGSSAPAPKRRKAAPAPPPIAVEAPADAAAVPVPAADEPAPAPAPAPPPPPAVSKRHAQAAAPVVEDTTTTDLGPPPQRSLRKKAVKGGGRANEVDEDGEPQPTHRKKATRSLRRAQDDEEDEDRAAAPKAEEPEKTDEPPPEKEAEAEPEPEPESDADADTDSPAAKRRRPKPFLFDITASLRGFQRHFSYTDDVNNELPNYDLGGAPAIALEAAAYPFKNKTGSLSAGFTAAFDYAVGLGTTYKVPTGGQEGTKSTTAFGYALGVRGNYVFGSSMANIVSVGAEFGAQSFIVDHPPPVRGNANIPSVEYKFIRPNVMGRFPLMDKLAVIGSVGYLMVSSAGEIVSTEYFRGPTSSASGLDLGLGAAYEIRMSSKGTLKFLELRPMLTFRRYTFKFNPADDDPFYATGATDDYVGLNLGAATRF